GLVARVHRMKDPSGAYGLYSFLRTTDMEKSDLSEHASSSAARALVLAGNFVFDVNAGDGKELVARESDLKALVSQVAPKATLGPYPLLWQTLPLDNFEPRSDRYILGFQTLNQLLPMPENGRDWLGFAIGTEGELAKYRVRGHDLTL